MAKLKRYLGLVGGDFFFRVVVTLLGIWGPVLLGYGWGLRVDPQHHHMGQTYFVIGGVLTIIYSAGIGRLNGRDQGWRERMDTFRYRTLSKLSEIESRQPVPSAQPRRKRRHWVLVGALVLLVKARSRKDST